MDESVLANDHRCTRGLPVEVDLEEETSAAETGSPLDPETLLKELVSVVLYELLGTWIVHNLKVNVIPKKIPRKKSTAVPLLIQAKKEL